MYSIAEQDTQTRHSFCCIFCSDIFLVSLAFGVPTIKRGKANYVMNTLQSLLNGASEEEKKDCVIIVFIAEIEDTKFVKNLLKELRDRYIHFKYFLKYS